MKKQAYTQPKMEIQEILNADVLTTLSGTQDKINAVEGGGGSFGTVRMSDFGL